MAEEERNENPIKEGKEGGQPPMLDEKRQRQLFGRFPAHGISRGGAARIVGCAASMIARPALRDPDFAARLQAAEHELEVGTEKGDSHKN